MPALAFASCFRMLASGHFRFLQLVDIFFSLIGECFLHLHFCLSWLLVTLSIDIVIGSQLNSMKTSSCSSCLSKMKKMKQNEAQSTRAELTPLCVDSCRRCFFAQSTRAELTPLCVDSCQRCFFAQSTRAELTPLCVNSCQRCFF